MVKEDPDSQNLLLRDFPHPWTEVSQTNPLISSADEPEFIPSNGIKVNSFINL